jgi:F-type H+-transporting ATPase subunit delta
MAVVSKRYAEALYDSKKDKAQGSLETLSSLYLSNDEFKEAMDNPKVTCTEKLDVIKEIVSEDKVFINFIDLVLREGRFSLIEDINKKYIELVHKSKGIITIKIISPYELSEEEASAISSKYKKLKNANEVKYEMKIDESLIGGIKVIVDGKLYDDSIKTKLNEML